MVRSPLTEINMAPDNDLRLVTLGRLALEAAGERPDVEALGKQKRKLAVLAVLALSSRPIARDTLMEMFWGDQDEVRARHSLSEALSHIRRVLGRETITARSTEVALAEHAPVMVDAVEFQRAARAGDAAGALALWGGPFLDAIYVGGSARFEEWLDRERTRLDKMFAETCCAACTSARRAERWDDCAAIAQRWLDADPLSQPAALALLGALEAPAGPDSDVRALQAFERLRARLAREFDTAPAPAVLARAAVIEERRAAERPAPAFASAPAEAATPAPQADVPLPAVTASPRPMGNARLTRPRGRHALGKGFGLAVVAFLTLLPHTATPAVNANAVAVLPFNVEGPADQAYLREGVVDLLSTDLDGAGGLHSVDPRVVLSAAGRGTRPLTADEARATAGRLGAGLYVHGGVVVAGGRMRITASLYDQRRKGTPVTEVAVDGAPGELFSMVDRLAARLVAASAGPEVSGMAGLAALTSGSMTALKSYLEGETHYRRGEYRQAFDAFRAATVEDSTFALAHYRLAQAANWSVAGGWTWDSIADASTRALRHAARLTPHARMLVEGYHAYIAADYDGAEHLYRSIVRSYPDDLEAWYQLGELLHHTNPVRGRSMTEARVPFERVLALDPANGAALTHLVRIAAREGRRTDLDSLLRRATELALPEARPEFAVERAYALGTPADQARALAELGRTTNDEMLRGTAHRVAVYIGRLDGAARVLSLLTVPSLPADVRAHAHIWLAELEVAHGRWRSAEDHLAMAAEANPFMAIEHRALLRALPFSPASRASLDSLRAALLEWNGNAPPTAYPWLTMTNGLHPVYRQLLLGLTAIRMGDVVEAGRRADALLALPEGAPHGREVARGFAESLRGLAAGGRGQDAEALRAFDRGRLRVSEGMLESVFGSQAYERWARAEALMRQGRLADADQWYASLPEISIDGLIWLGPSHLRRGEIAERLGNRAAAAAHYAKFVEVWKDCDPELRPQVAAAANRLRQLRR